MHFEFPFGKAAFWIFLMAILSGVAILMMDRRPADQVKPDLTFVIFTTIHVDAYTPAIAEFEKLKGVKIHLQLVDARALQSRLQAALQVGAEVPDMVELLNGSMGTFTRGPLEDVGFVDLTDRIKSSDLPDRIPSSRFSIWSSRGHIFALPHDLHPMVLAYRRDLIEQLGIDVNKLDTWDEFVRVGQEIAKIKDENGLPRYYMIDLPAGGDQLRQFLLQQGVSLFDEKGAVVFDSDMTAKTACWYARQVAGPNQIAFSAGWGQTLSKCMADGHALFYCTPDWRSHAFEQDVPSLSGKMALMPLPAWTKGGRRVSTWGGTGLAITKKAQKEGKFELAWELANFLYYNTAYLGPRFAKMNILPPVKDAWSLPELNAPRPYYSGQPIGRIFADLATDVPADYVTAYSTLAETKLNEAFNNILQRYQTQGDRGLEDYARDELKRCADRVREVMARNAFYAQKREEGK